MNSVPLPQIQGQALCGTTQSVAFWATAIPSTSSYRIAYDFAAGTDQGFESYALVCSSLATALLLTSNRLTLLY
jgi:hypothetical protein